MRDVEPDCAISDRLLQEARAGDRRALDELLSRNEAFLRRFIESRLEPQLRARVDSSDVVQEVWLEAFRRLPAYVNEPGIPFRLWLRQLAQDQLIMMWRRHCKASRRSVTREVSWPDQSSLLLARQLVSANSTPSKKLNQQDLAQRVGQAVGQLAAVDREVLLMRTYEGLSFDEVGYLLEIEPTAARKRHGRALLRLHALLVAGGLTESQL